MHSEPNVHQNTPRSLRASFHPSSPCDYFKGTLIELKEKEKQFPSSSVSKKLQHPVSDFRLAQAAPGWVDSTLSPVTTIIWRVFTCQ